MRSSQDASEEAARKLLRNVFGPAAFDQNVPFSSILPVGSGTTPGGRKCLNVIKLAGSFSFSPRETRGSLLSSSKVIQSGRGSSRGLKFKKGKRSVLTCTPKPFNRKFPPNLKEILFY